MPQFKPGDENYRPPPGTPEEGRAILLALVAELRALNDNLRENTAVMREAMERSVVVGGSPSPFAGAGTITQAVTEALTQFGVFEDDDEPAPRRRRRR